MNAGRELDAVVAEKVMGWKRVVVPKDYDGLNAGVTLLPTTSTDVGWAPKGAYQLWHFCPSYSFDIRAAWLIVEKLRERKEIYQVDCAWLRGANGYPDIYRSVVVMDGLRSVTADANTAPLAICLAALKAVDVEVPA